MKPLTDVQVSFLEAGRRKMSIGDRLETVPLARPIGLCSTMSGPLAGLIRRGWLEERKANLFYTTATGEDALERHYAKAQGKSA